MSQIPNDETWWDSVETDLPHPGVVTDMRLGVSGPPEDLPDGDAEWEDDS